MNASRIKHLLPTIAAIIAAPAWAAPMPREMTFQGQIAQAGKPYSGQADLRFTLFDVASAGSPRDQAEFQDVTIENGLFSLELGFQDKFFNTEDAFWVEVSVRTPHDPTNTGAYTTLTPRTSIQPAPYALHTRGLYVDPEGELGVGVTNPQATLHLGGDPGVDGVMFPDGTLQTTAASNDPSTPWEKTNPNHIYYNQGWVAIGTSTPLSPLHIEGPNNPVEAPTLTLMPRVGDSTESGRIRFREVDTNLRGAFIHYDGLGNDLHIGTHQVASSDTNDDVNLITLARVSESVGIHMDSPIYPLHVGGFARFEDSITVTENLSLVDSGGSTRAEITAPGQGGTVEVTNGSTSGSAKMTAVGTGGGGEITLDAADGSLSARLAGNGSGNAGELQLRNNTGVTTLLLQGDDGFDDTSSNILMMNNSVTNVELDGFESNGGVVRVTSQTTGGEAALLGDGVNAAGELQLRNSLGTRTVSIYGDETDAGGANFYYQNGTQIGIELDVEGWSAEAAISLFNENGFETVRIAADENNDGGDIRLNNRDGVETCQLDADYSGSGESRLRVDVVEILGGADLSEQFDVRPAPSSSRGDDEPIEAQPGMVVSIDPQHLGELIVSTTAYDRTVAGIVSGAGGVKPGLLMGQRNTAANGKHAVALTGRVWVRATDAGGAIRPGDLLTTSNLPGTAMKVADHDRAQGAIIGKAMSPLDADEGLVLVLVGLQ